MSIEIGDSVKIVNAIDPIKMVVIDLNSATLL